MAAALVGALCAGAAPVRAQGSAAGSDALRLYVMDCGAMRGLPRERFLPDQGEDGELSLVNRCYLVQHPQGLLLWDTGLPSALSWWIVRTLAWVASLGEYDLELDRTLADQLSEIGVAPADIDYVAFSHLHTDHVGAANDFAGSTWLVQRPELDVAFDGSGRAGFDASYYDALEQSERRVLEGDHDVFGDGRVVILSAPGHTPGHQCLFLDLADTGPVVLSGDLYHTLRNRELRLAPSFNVDREQSVRSMERIEAFLAERGARLLIQHDPDSNRDVPLSPLYLE